MKRIEDIWNMDMTMLEKIASDDAIEVPGSLKHKLATTARALELYENGKESHRSTPHFKPGHVLYPVAAASAIGIALVVHYNEPKDTFNDPLLAYAQVEETFSFIGSKMNSGMEMAAEAEPIFDRTISKILK